MIDDDPTYYQRRAAEEKAAADRATHAAAVKAHATLAQQYSALAGLGDQGGRSERKAERSIG